MENLSRDPFNPRRFILTLALAMIVSLAAALEAPCARGQTADGLWAALPTIQFLPPGDTPNSVFIFGGRMSSTNIGSTALFNLALYGTRQAGQRWDNSIFGAAYDRDMVGFGHGLVLGAEVGFADRTGNYALCCEPIVLSDRILQSYEFWGGPQIRYAGVLLFNAIRVGGAVTFGLSAATNSIGRELDRELTTGANPHLLYYLGPEFDFSTPSLPNVEVVVRLQHRSGCKAFGFLPTLGNMQEGYNADVVGLRYRF